MDAIKEARESTEFANAAPDSQWRIEFTAMAQAYAAIAQAEQLKRIADALEAKKQKPLDPSAFISELS